MVTSDTSHDLLIISGLTLMAGAAMPLGALLGRLDQLHPQWLTSELRHGIIAFGAGALLSAIALVLVPEGFEVLSPWWAALCFAMGGLAFLLLDVWLAKQQSSAGQLAAMLSDFIPEAIALGAAFVHSKATGLLLAVLIALQNLPEGFNAYRELTDKDPNTGARTIIAFSIMALLGPLAGVLGYLFLAHHPAVVAGLMMFASGGILYLVFQDIAPQVKLENSWAPPLGAVAGFLLGLIGYLLVHH